MNERGSDNVRGNQNHIRSEVGVRQCIRMNDRGAENVRGNHYHMRSEVGVRQRIRMNDRGAENVRGKQNRIQFGFAFPHRNDRLAEINLNTAKTHLSPTKY
jgi:hypothetical protein